MIGEKWENYQKHMGNYGNIRGKKGNMENYGTSVFELPDSSTVRGTNSDGYAGIPDVMTNMTPFDPSTSR